MNSWLNYSSFLTLTLCCHPQTLQMGIKHFSGLFVMLCVGVALSLLTTLGEHIVHRWLIPRMQQSSQHKYWLHTSQVSSFAQFHAGFITHNYMSSWWHVVALKPSFAHYSLCNSQLHFSLIILNLIVFLAITSST